MEHTPPPPRWCQGATAVNVHPLNGGAVHDRELVGTCTVCGQLVTVHGEDGPYRHETRDYTAAVRRMLAGLS